MKYFGNKYLKVVANNENIYEIMAFLCLTNNKKKAKINAVMD